MRTDPQKEIFNQGPNVRATNMVPKYLQPKWYLSELSQHWHLSDCILSGNDRVDDSVGAITLP